MQASQSIPSTASSARAVEDAPSDTGGRRVKHLVVSIAARILLVILGLAVPLLVLELALRFLGPVLPGSYAAALYLEPHPIYGRFNLPNSGGWVRTPEYTTRVNFNSHGLRERELPYEKPAGTQRVLVLGDSFVEGAEVPVESTVSRVLERNLNDAYEAPIETINAGVGGFGTAQEYLLFKEEGVKFQPDVTVVVFYMGNDITNNGFKLKDGPSERDKPFYVLGPNGQLRSLDFKVKKPQNLNLVENLRRESLLFGVLDTGVLAKLRNSDDSEDGGQDRLMRTLVKAQMPVYREKPGSDWDDSWKVTEALLVAMRNEAAKAGSKLLILDAPSKYEVYEQDWNELREAYNMDTRGWDLTAPSRRLAALAARNGIPYADPRPDMRAALDGPRMFYQRDVHWTATGHAIVARVIANAIATDALLSTAPAQ
jgi:hypothetical protein